MLAQLFKLIFCTVAGAMISFSFNVAYGSTTDLSAKPKLENNHTSKQNCYPPKCQIG